MSQNKTYSVTELNLLLKSILDSNDELISVLVKGEISNLKKYPNGRCYFTMKDETSQISAVIWEFNHVNTKDVLDGKKVLVIGKVSVYKGSGQCQIDVRGVKPEGAGDLAEKLEKLKKELFAAGYFDEAHKRKLPEFPKKIGVITSETGAVIEDIKNTIKRRYPLAEIILYPAIVQGEYSKDDLVKKLKYANSKMEVDTLIIGRGGGSLEDLWSFNEKDVALAVYNSKIPVISAVGHQTDFTICDMVADLRVETPTAAANAATPDVIDLKNRIDKDISMLNGNFFNLIDSKKLLVKELDKKLAYNSPENKLKLAFEKLNSLSLSLNKNLTTIIDNYKARIDLSNVKLNSNFVNVYNYKKTTFEKYAYTLKNLSPFTIMEKGYSIVYKDGKVIRSSNELKANDLIDIKFNEGSIKAKVEE